MLICFLCALNASLAKRVLARTDEVREMKAAEETERREQVREGVR